MTEIISTCDGVPEEQYDTCTGDNVGIDPCPAGQARYWMYQVTDTSRVLIARYCRVPDTETPPIDDIVAQAVDSVSPNPATARVQPADGKPLPLGLDAYFMVDVPEQDPVTVGPVLGVTATVWLAEPTFIWNWGDGSAPYETTSAGGPHPDGDVTHAYETPGEYEATLTVRWTIHYSVQGPGISIPDSVWGTLTQSQTSTVPVHIVEARAVLVD